MDTMVKVGFNFLNAMSVCIYSQV